VLLHSIIIPINFVLNFVYPFTLRVLFPKLLNGHLDIYYGN